MSSGPSHHNPGWRACQPLPFWLPLFLLGRVCVLLPVILMRLTKSPILLTTGRVQIPGRAPHTPGWLLQGFTWDQVLLLLCKPEPVPPVVEALVENAASPVENERGWGAGIDSLVIYLECLDSTVFDANPSLDFSVMRMPKFHLCLI